MLPTRRTSVDGSSQGLDLGAGNDNRSLCCDDEVARNAPSQGGNLSVVVVDLLIHCVALRLNASGYGARLATR